MRDNGPPDGAAKTAGTVVVPPGLDRAGDYCDSCRTELTPEIPFQCVRCGAEVGPYAVTEGGCVHCRGRVLRFQSLVCLGMYRDSLRKAVLGAKWSASSAEMESLAQLLLETRREQLADLRADLLIPIPQSLSSRFTRHFNPAAQIAEVLGRGLSIPTNLHVLARRRHTIPQKRVSVQQRFGNQKDSFRVTDARLLQRKRVLLVDDVSTSGATCSEAARLLRKHGAAECHVAVIARVLDGSA